MMTDLPLVSVITPSYNQGRFIEETILSVLGQDYPNIEYIIVDGVSSDNTLEIIKRYDNRIRWISEPDNGQSAAINKGFGMAGGEILCWLNSDDTFEPGAIRCVVEYLQSHPDVMMVYGDGNLIDEQGRFVKRFPYTRPFDLWALVYLPDYILQPATFFRRGILDTVGFLDEGLHWCMDLDFWIRIGGRYKVDYTKHLYANARIYHETKSGSGGIRRLIEIASVLRRHSNKFFPMVYLAYSGATFNRFVQKKASSLSFIISPTVDYIRTFLRQYMSNCHGVYPDSWLGRKARFMFPAQLQSRAINFLLDVPEDERLVPNAVTVKINAEVIVNKMIFASGPLSLLVPYDRLCQNPTEIEIAFKEYLPPDKERRRLACKLISIEQLPVETI